MNSELRLKIGVMGGAGDGIPEAHLAKATRLGEAIAKSDCVTVTGACPGLPLAAARGAKRHGGLVLGVSPGLSLDEHAYKYESPTVHHDLLVFTGSGLMGREIVNIRSSDIVAIVGGSSGTLGEFAIAYDEGKLIGVLRGTGGVSDIVEGILKACAKDTGARVIYDSDPEALVHELIRIYRLEHFRRPSCFCHESGSVNSELTEGYEQDVVCGMWVDHERAAAKRIRDDRRFVFCSLQCAAEFDENEAEFRSAS